MMAADLALVRDHIAVRSGSSPTPSINTIDDRSAVRRSRTQQFPVNSPRIPELSANPSKGSAPALQFSTSLCTTTPRTPPTSSSPSPCTNLPSRAFRGCTASRCRPSSAQRGRTERGCVSGCSGPGGQKTTLGRPCGGSRPVLF